MSEFSDERSEATHNGTDKEGSSEYTEEVHDRFEDLKGSIGAVLLRTTISSILLVVLIILTLKQRRTQ